MCCKRKTNDNLDSINVQTLKIGKTKCTSTATVNRTLTLPDTDGQLAVVSTNLVTTDTTQVISGAKTFTNKVTIGSGSGVPPVLTYTTGYTLPSKNIVLYDTGGGTSLRYSGFGVANSEITYNADTTTTDHVFYAATSDVARNEVARIKGNGSMVIPGSYSMKLSGFTQSIAPIILTANRNCFFPDANGTVVIDSAVQTLTNKTIGAVTFSSSINAGRLAVTQTPLLSSDVTVNASSGRITLAGSLTGPGVTTFTVLNSFVSSNSVVVASVGEASLPVTGGSACVVFVGSVANGSFKLQVYNFLTSTSGVPVVHFFVC